MAECKPCVTPMEERLKLTNASTTMKVDAIRPDIALVVGYVNLFMEDPREDHWAAVKRLLRYVKGTMD